MNTKSSKINILLVEDESIIAFSEKTLLESYGYNVIIVNSGKIAINTVKQNNDIDLILMDIDLGEGIDGTETAKIILSDKDIPIVFLSSHCEPEIVKKTEKIISYGYILKSSSITVIDASIKMAFKLFDSKFKTNIKYNIIKQNEDEFRKLNNEYDIVFNSTTSALFLLKVHDSETFTYIRTNRVQQELTGISFQEISNKTPIELLGENHGRVINDNYKKCYNAKEPITYEETIDLPGGKNIWETTLSPIIENNEVTHIVGSSINITKRKELYENFLSLAENAPDIVARFDKDLRHLYINPIIEKYTGIQRDKFIGFTNKDLKMSEENVKFWSKQLNEIFQTKQEKEIFFDYLTSNGRKYFHSRMVPEFNQNGLVKSVLSVTRDITFQKTAEEKIKSLLFEKEMLLSETHHRIKNNMNVIRSILLLEANKQNSNSNCKNILDDCANRVITMLTLYDYLYQIEIKHEIDISFYIKNLIKQFIEIYKHKSFNTDVHIQEILLKPNIISKIGIIINELFTNSIKYAFQGIEKPVISLSLTKTDDTISILFFDNGVGLPDSVSIENADSFGMQLIDMLVKELNGTMKVDRTSGTKFIINFNS